MNSEPNTITRREAFLCGLNGAVAVAVVSSGIAQGEPVDSPPGPAFVPENDYPFFGGELPNAYKEKS